MKNGTDQGFSTDDEWYMKGIPPSHFVKGHVQPRRQNKMSLEDSKGKNSTLRALQELTKQEKVMYNAKKKKNDQSRALSGDVNMGFTNYYKINGGT